MREAEFVQPLEKRLDAERREHVHGRNVERVRQRVPHPHGPAEAAAIVAGLVELAARDAHTSSGSSRQDRRRAGSSRRSSASS